MTAADIWSVMPLVIIASGALMVLLLGAFIPGRFGNSLAIASLLGASLCVVLRPAQQVASTLGISVTPFARFFTLLFCLTAVLTLLLSHDYNERHGIRGEEYPATVLFAAFGMLVVVAATNLLLLFLGLEALTFAFYILVAFDRNRPESAEAGLKYLLLGAVAAAFIAFGIALLYAGSGTLALVPAMQTAINPGTGRALAMAGWGLLLAGLAFKISLVPLHLWTPDVYQGAPTPVVAFLSTGSKGAAFAALLLLIPALGGSAFLHEPLWWLSLLSMLVGNLAALLQSNVKRMLAYSSIAQMGYVTLALLAGGRDGFLAVALYVVFYSAMNLAAFGAIASLSGGSPADLVEDYRGIGYSRPFQGAVLALALFALAGIPPTIGFFGKFAIFTAAIRGGEIPLAIIGIGTAIISAYYYLRVVVNLYMHPVQANSSPSRATLPETIALSALAVFIIAAGIYPTPLLALIDAILH